MSDSGEPTKIIIQLVLHKALWNANEMCGFGVQAMNSIFVSIGCEQDS